MIFGAAGQSNQFDKSLTHKNSSENFSITQSMQEAESEKIRRDLINVSHSQTYLHRLNVSKSGATLPASASNKKMNIIAY